MEPSRLLAELDEIIADYDARIEKAEQAAAELERLRAEREAHVQARRLLAGDLTAPVMGANGDNMTVHPITKRLYSEGAAHAEKTANLLTAIHDAGIPSLRALADMARAKFKGRKIQQAHLSFAAQGERPIDLDVARWIEGLCGYKATKKNWPKLRD